MNHALTLTGSKINHLPAAVFRLYEILRQNYMGQYEETADPSPRYDKEANAYIAGDVVMTPAFMVVTVGYEETGREGRYRYQARIEAPDAAFRATLTIPCGLAFLQRYYYPIRRFLRANPAKYDRPGVPGRPYEGMTIVVLDTEMQRPYVTQFSGCLLRYQKGTWTMDPTERRNLYIRLPEGVRVDPFVRKVTGLTREFLDKNGVDEDEALPAIAEFLSEADIVCGHSVLLDIEILRERFLYAGWDLDEMPACLRRDDLIDTQVLMEYLYDLSGMIKLERAAEMAGVVAEGDVFHDARTDADVTARLYMALSPQYMERYHMMPIVKEDMMHAPHDVAILNAILGKRVRIPR